MDFIGSAGTFVGCASYFLNVKKDLATYVVEPGELRKHVFGTMTGGASTFIREPSTPNSKTNFKAINMYCPATHYAHRRECRGSRRM